MVRIAIDMDEVIADFTAKLLQDATMKNNGSAVILNLIWQG